MTKVVEQTVHECHRQSESCAYTAAALYIWQKAARRWRAVFLIAPIIFSGFAGSQILGLIVGAEAQVAALLSGLLAGFFPAMYVSLNMDMKVFEIGRSASEFTNLRDRFRQAANIISEQGEAELLATFESLMDRMDAARAAAPPSPEWCFTQAQAKFKSGDYTFDYDEKPAG